MTREQVVQLHLNNWVQLERFRRQAALAIVAAYSASPYQEFKCNSDMIQTAIGIAEQLTAALSETKKPKSEIKSHGQKSRVRTGRAGR